MFPMLWWPDYVVLLALCVLAGVGFGLFVAFLIKR